MCRNVVGKLFTVVSERYPLLYSQVSPISAIKSTAPVDVVPTVPTAVSEFTDRRSMSLTDEEGDQASLDVLLNRRSHGLAAKAVTVCVSHWERLEGDAQQERGLSSVRVPMAHCRPPRTFAPSECVCVLPYMTSLWPYLSLEASMSVCSCSASTARARSRAAIAAVSADSDAEPYFQLRSWPAWRPE